MTDLHDDVQPRSGLVAIDEIQRRRDTGVLDTALAFSAVSSLVGTDRLFTAGSE